ncbi:MAG: cysteine peptidase family C39 domain-containing protein [Planctomycetota bacterium]|jgi:ABC-type bacteriocin/lantibiotic exporter with double-glycine peptidase domain
MTPAEKLDQLCGPSCLAFCAQWLGTEANVRDVAELAGLSATGTSLAGLAEAAAQLGLEGRCYRLALKDLKRINSKTPGIAHLDGGHFVVAWMDGPDAVTVIEPPRRIGQEGLQDFGRRWNGAILVVSRPGEQPKLPLFYLKWGLAAGLVGAAVVWALKRRAMAARAP